MGLVTSKIYYPRADGKSLWNCVLILAAISPAKGHGSLQGQAGRHLTQQARRQFLRPLVLPISIFSRFKKKWSTLALYTPVCKVFGHNNLFSSLNLYPDTNFVVSGFRRIYVGSCAFTHDHICSIIFRI